MNRAAKTALEVFDDILNKEKLDRNDLELIIEKIKVYEDPLEIQLKADIDSLLRCGELPAGMEKAANFRPCSHLNDSQLLQTQKRPLKNTLFCPAVHPDINHVPVSVSFGQPPPLVSILHYVQHCV